MGFIDDPAIGVAPMRKRSISSSDDGAERNARLSFPKPRVKGRAFSTIQLGGLTRVAPKNTQFLREEGWILLAQSPRFLMEKEMNID